MNNEKVYSRDGEVYDDLDLIMDELCNYEDLNIGDTVEIYEAVAVKAKHSDFIHGFQIIEGMMEQAYDEHGEWSENYLDDLGREKVKELELLVINWLNKNTSAPTFYKVTDVKKISAEVD